MAGLKINKKVAKEVKIDELSVKSKDKLNNSINDTENSNNDIVEFGEFKSSIDSVIGGDSIVSDEDGDGGEDTKGNIKMLIIGGVLLVVIAIGVVSVISIKGVKNEDMSQQGGVVIDESMLENNSEEESVVNEGDTDGVSVEESEVVVEDDVNNGAIKEDKVVYENTLLGLALKYPSNWYVEERADVLLNMVQSTNVSGNIDLLTNEVKLAGVVMDFSARDDLGTKISLGVSPLVITGDTKLADIKSLSDIISVGTAEQIDNQIKNNIESGGGKLLSSVPSVLKDIGNYKVIQSVYQFEKNGIKMDVIQMIIPYGVNNIVLTGSNKVGTNPINKEEIMVSMLGSLGKVGDVVLNEIGESDVSNKEGEVTDDTNSEEVSE